MLLFERSFQDCEMRLTHFVLCFAFVTAVWHRTRPDELAKLLWRESCKCDRAAVVMRYTFDFESSVWWLLEYHGSLGFIVVGVESSDATCM